MSKAYTRILIVHLPITFKFESKVNLNICQKRIQEQYWKIENALQNR